MKHNQKQSTKFRPWIIASLSGLALISSTLASNAQDFSLRNGGYVINEFDTSAEVGSYGDGGWGGNASASFTWSTTNDITSDAGVTNNPGSGSIEWQVAWGQPAGSGDQDVSGTQWFANINDINNFADFSFDFMILPDCATDAGKTTYGTLEPTFCGSQGWYQYTFGSLSLPVGTYLPGVWYHADFPLSSPMPGDYCTGWGFKMQQSKNNTGITNVTDILVDNVVLEPAATPPPPPTMSIAPVTTPPGLAMVLPGTLNANGQDGMLLEATSASAGPNFTWAGAQTNVTYSMTISSFPSASYGPCQAVIYLVPNGGPGDVVINAVAAAAVQLVVQGNPDGTATATFAYKTDSSGTAPNLGVVSVTNSSGPIGTWSLTFNDTATSDTAFTISGPGVTATGSFPSEDLVQNYFENPVSAYFGAFNQAGTNSAGQVVTFSQLHIDGTQNALYGGGPIDDIAANDGGVLDTTDWTLCYRYQSEAPNTLIMQATDKDWVRWTLPNTNDLWTTSVLGAGASWTDTQLAGATPTTQPVGLGNSAEALVAPSSFGQTTTGYFFIAPATWAP